MTTAMTNNNTTSMQDERPVVLSVEHVAKSFKLPTEQASGLKQAFLNWTKGIKGYTEQKVLKDINFEVHQGDFFGIVGRNGSGKSTLLKIISGIYVPEKGKVTVNGKLVPFIELGVGFNPELTGRENVYLNGALLGFSHDEIDAMYDDIVEFAELEDFMDQKLKNYSSGMQVRLAFSVAIKAQGDILVLDEVLAVGDEAFQRKCDNFFAQIKKDPTKTVILVTHSMAAVKKYCDKAILIKDGEIIASGDKDNVADRYTLENLQAEKKLERPQENSEYAVGLSDILPEFRVSPVSDLLCTTASDFRFKVEYKYNGTDNYYLVVAMQDLQRGGVVFAKNYIGKGAGRHTLQLELPLSMFNNGDYRIFSSLHTYKENPADAVMAGFTNDRHACDFVIRDSSIADSFGLINEKTLTYQLLENK